MRGANGGSVPIEDQEGGNSIGLELLEDARLGIAKHGDAHAESRDELAQLFRGDIGIIYADPEEGDGASLVLIGDFLQDGQLFATWGGTRWRRRRGR